MGWPGTQALGTILGLYLLIDGWEANEKRAFLSYVEALGEEGNDTRLDQRGASDSRCSRGCRACL